MHIERRRIGSADPFKSPLAAPEFHAALEVRIEDPHAILSPKGPWMEPSPLPRLSHCREEDKSEAWEEGECDNQATSTHPSSSLDDLIVSKDQINSPKPKKRAIFTG